MITVTPGEGGALTYTDTHGRQTVVQVLPGAVTETVTLVFTPVPTQTDVGRPCSAGHAFALAIYRADELLAGSGFNTPVHITTHYSEEDVAGLLETALELDYWSGRAWENAACGDGGRRPEDNWICVPIQHLSDFVLYGPRIPSGGVTLPGPARRPRCWGLALVAVLGSLGLALAPRREQAGTARGQWISTSTLMPQRNPSGCSSSLMVTA